MELIEHPKYAINLIQTLSNNYIPLLNMHYIIVDTLECKKISLIIQIQLAKKGYTPL